MIARDHADGPALLRQPTVLDRHLRTYLFTTESITGEESEAEAGDGAVGTPAGSLGIGSLKGVE